MKITVWLHVDADGKDIEGTKHDAQPPYADAPCVELDGAQVCIRCGSKPLRVSGFKNCEEMTSEALHAACGCKECGKHVGTIKVEHQSLFGEDEDRAVLFGRPRVY